MLEITNEKLEINKKKTTGTPIKKKVNIGSYKPPSGHRRMSNRKHNKMINKMHTKRIILLINKRAWQL